MTDFTIRRFESSDTERIRELHEEAMRVEGAYDENIPDTDLERVEEEYLSDGEFLVGLFGGKIVAMGAIRSVSESMAELHETKATPVAELKRMRVDPDHQRRGYGQRIYDALESTAREQGYRELVLDTSPTLDGAQRLYEGNGFQRERHVELDAFDGSIELLLYRKPLSD